MPMLRLSGAQVDLAGRVEHRVVAERDAARVGRLEAGQAAQRRRLAAAARARAAPGTRPPRSRGRGRPSAWSAACRRSACQAFDARGTSMYLEVTPSDVVSRRATHRPSIDQLVSGATMVSARPHLRSGHAGRAGSTKIATRPGAMSQRNRAFHFSTYAAAASGCMPSRSMHPDLVVGDQRAGDVGQHRADGTLHQLLALRPTA